MPWMSQRNPHVSDADFSHTAVTLRSHTSGGSSVISVGELCNRAQNLPCSPQGVVLVLLTAASDFLQLQSSQGLHMNRGQPLSTLLTTGGDRINEQDLPPKSAPHMLLCSCVSRDANVAQPALLSRLSNLRFQS